MRTIRFLGAGLLTLSLAACITPHSYVDPALHDTAWTAIKPPAQKQAVGLTIEFFRNGERLARADKTLRASLERALAKSGVVVLQPTGATATLTAKFDNIADISEAMKKGFGTGLTFGAKGSSVTDAYAITFIYDDGSGPIEKHYEHALHTTIGNAPAPTSAAPMSPVQAFDQVVEDALIHFLRDLQAEGKLVIGRDGSARFVG